MKYVFFMTPTCPNCTEIKEYLETAGVSGEIIDASEEAGFEKAKEYGVMGVPLMIFFNDKGSELNRADNIDDIRKVIENKSLAGL